VSTIFSNFRSNVAILIISALIQFDSYRLLWGLLCVTWNSGEGK
jgi:hypothetical protein